jgi:hypothetical protein
LNGLAKRSTLESHSDSARRSILDRRELLSHLFRSRRGTLWIVLGTLAVVAFWGVAAAYVVPTVIRSAYHGTSLNIFNDILEGRATRPVEAYLAAWDRLASHVSVLLLAAGVFALILTRPSTLAFIHRRRSWLVYALFAFIVGGHLFEIVTGAGMSTPEHWPFSAYPMYSLVLENNAMQGFRVFGVIDQDVDGEADDELILNDFAYLRPFDRSRLGQALESIWKRGDEEALRHALVDCLSRYERHRVLGHHHGPRLNGLRLYRLTWTSDPSIVQSAPLKRELLFAVMSQPKGVY